MVASDRDMRVGAGADRSSAAQSPELSSPGRRSGLFEGKTTVVALVGPQATGKSTLARTLTGRFEEHPGVRGNGSGQEKGKGTATAGTFTSLPRTCYGRMSSELVLEDCSGSTEAFEESVRVAEASDLAVVVIDARVSSVGRATPYLRMLTEMKKPHLVFVNRVDDEDCELDGVVAALSRISAERTLIQQYPLTLKRRVAGAVLLWNESASLFTGDGEKVIPLPEDARSAEAAARQEFLESLSDFDDRVLIDLLDERLPAIRVLAQDLREGLSADAFVPVFFGSAAKGFGLTHLADALKGFEIHSSEQQMGLEAAPAIDIPAQSSERPTVRYLQQGEFGKRGRASLFRVESGLLQSGAVIEGQRFGTLFTPAPGMNVWREVAECPKGEIFLALKVAAEEASHLTGAQQSLDKGTAGVTPRLSPSHYAQAVKVLRGSKPEKVMQCLERLAREDPSVRVEHVDLGGGETVLIGSGPEQLELIRQHMRTRFDLEVELTSRAIDYRERLSAPVHGVSGRYKHQNGGHGAFGDVVMNFIPAAPGSGITFREEIAGGVVPRQYFAAIEAGAREALQRGSHGYPLLDLEVVLVDGSYHAVDSSEMAFRNAARLAVRSLLEQAGTVLLEPYVDVRITLPESQMGAALQLVASLRGQVHGFVLSDRLPGWNEATVSLPEVELASLIRSVRSQSQGLGFFDVHGMEADKRYAPAPHGSAH